MLKEEQMPERVEVRNAFPTPIAMAKLPDAETLNKRPVPRQILALQVVEKTPALADHCDQPATRMMILRVGLEMLSQTFDTLREECDLYFR